MSHIYPFFSLSLAIVVLALCTSCEPEPADWTYSTDNTMSDLGYDDLYSISNGEVDANNSLRSCGVISLDSTPNTFFPLTMTIDYGTSSVCTDGRTRSGIVTINFSDKWSHTGMTCQIIPNNYIVNGYKVDGEITITNEGLINGSPTYRSEVKNGVFTTPEGDVILRDCIKYWTWASGASTPFNLSDDVWQVSCSATGTTRNGNAFSASTTSPVLKSNNCNWIQEGIIEVTPLNGGLTRSIDYGDGDCENIARVSYGNWNMDITMN